MPFESLQDMFQGDTVRVARDRVTLLQRWDVDAANEIPDVVLLGVTQYG